MLVLVLVLAVATAGSVPLSTPVVGAEASYASTPRGVRLSGQAAELGSWQRAWKDGDWFRTLQSRKSQYNFSVWIYSVLSRVQNYVLCRVHWGLNQYTYDIRCSPPPRAAGGARIDATPSPRAPRAPAYGTPMLL